MNSHILTFNSNFDTFNPDLFFKNFHHHEEFNNSKNYTFKSFSNDYGHGKREYAYYLYIFKNSTGFSKKRKFIVVHEQLAIDELKQLSKYCNCDYHKDTSLSNQLFGTNYGCKCVYSKDSDFSQNVIDGSRNRMVIDQPKAQPLLINLDNTLDK